MSTWFEDDAFWDVFQAGMFSADRWQAATAEVDKLLQLVAMSPGAAVLDLACGPGRHALELARRGFRVTGVDRTAVYLNQAREAAARDNLAAEWVQTDMREFHRDGAFDAALSLFTSFGFFDDPADDRCVAGNLFRSLRPGGRVVIEILGKEVLARKFQPTSWSRLPDGRLWLEERFIRDDWTAVDARWILIDGTERFERMLRLRLYSAAELCTLLRDVGFVSPRSFGGLDGTPYDHNAARLVVVAEHPG